MTIQKVLDGRDNVIAIVKWGYYKKPGDFEMEVARPADPYYKTDSSYVGQFRYGVSEDLESAPHWSQDIELWEEKEILLKWRDAFSTRSNS